MTSIGPLLGFGVAMGTIGGVTLSATGTVPASKDTGIGFGTVVAGGALVALSLLGRKPMLPAAALGAGLVGFGAATLLAPDAPGSALPRPRPSAGPAPGATSRPDSSDAAGDRDDSDLPFNIRRNDGPTPNGGDYSISIFSDDEGNPAHPDVATRVSVTEYEADGTYVSSTSGTLGD